METVGPQVLRAELRREHSPHQNARNEQGHRRQDRGNQDDQRTPRHRPHFTRPLAQDRLDRVCARRAYAHAKYLEGVRAPRKESEEKAREALAMFASAMNWLEDDPVGFDAAHTEIHAAGPHVRRGYESGCKLHWTGEAYEQRCPAALCHRRWGFSVEFIVREWHCSLCGATPEDCPHLQGVVYDEAVCHRVITDAEVIGLAVVDRPAFPDARLEAIGVPTSELRRRIPGLRDGQRVRCDLCLQGLSECPGFSDARDSFGMH